MKPLELEELEKKILNDMDKLPEATKLYLHPKTRFTFAGKYGQHSVDPFHFQNLEMIANYEFKENEYAIR